MPKGSPLSPEALHLIRRVVDQVGAQVVAEKAQVARQTVEKAVAGGNLIFATARAIYDACVALQGVGSVTS